jgi:hypothetical protein
MPTTATSPKDEQDSPWKQILRQYLQEAMAFFFPTIAEAVDWSVPPVFLDKEFRQLAPEAKTGRRFADQLVQLQRKRGKPLILLLHIEIHGPPEDAGNQTGQSRPQSLEALAHPTAL